MLPYRPMAAAASASADERMLADLVRPGTGKYSRQDLVRLVYIDRGHPAVHIVAIKLAEIVARDHVAHDRVALIARPDIVERRPSRAIQSESLIVEPVVRMAHTQMMSDLMYRGRGGTVGFTVESGTHDLVVCLSAVDLIVHRYTFERRFDLCRYKKGEDRHFVVGVTLEILQFVIPSVEEHIPERYARPSAVPVTRPAGFRTLHDMRTGTRLETRPKMDVR